jgi:hypothetical protein
MMCGFCHDPVAGTWPRLQRFSITRDAALEKTA